MTQPKTSRLEQPTGTESPSALRPDLIRKERLNLERLSVHEKRVREALREGRETWIPIVSPCSTANGGIITWKAAVRFLEGDKSEAERRHDTSLLAWWCQNSMLTCIPAAGAASRYLGPLHKFVSEIESHAPGLAAAFEKAWTAEKDATLNAKLRAELADALASLTPPPDYMRLAGHLRRLRSGKTREDFLRTRSALSELVTFGSMQRTVSSLSAARLAHKPGGGQDLKGNDASKSEESSDNGILRRPWLRASRRASPTLFRTLPRVAAAVSPRSLTSTLGAEAEQTLEAYVAGKVTLRAFGKAPKALVPTTEEGDTFLRLKLVEQTTLLPCAANILISPADQSEAFRQEIAKEGDILKSLVVNPFELAGTPFAPEFLRRPGDAKRGGWHVKEQGRNLSTLRFRRDGSPFLNEDGSYSVVAAGHGELLHLFPEFAAEFPEAECLHIRNIDNIIGTTGERREELSVPADVFRIVRDCLEYARTRVDDFIGEFSKRDSGTSDLRLADVELLEACEYLSGLLGPHASRPREQVLHDAEGLYVGFTAEALHETFRALFHWNPLDAASDSEAAWRKIQQELAKPLSVFGVVRKETGDMGGGPVFVKTADGKRVKICLEMPHASPEDSAEYFGPRGKATHFNPVLVFFEMKTHCRAFEQNRSIQGRHVDFSSLFDDRFWLLSKKEFQGTPVCYHETVLYELVGNSATTNLLFVEVPRTLFVPHKGVFDSMGQDRRSYGFHETLQELERRT
jgi:hypothetical protein